MLNVHVIHAKYLVNRVGIFEMLLTRLKQANMLNAVNMITDKDPAEIVAEDVVNVFSKVHLPQEDKLVHFNAVIKPLGATQISNCLKHKMALEAVASCPDDNQMHLVIEDDILFNDEVVASLQKAMDHAKQTAASNGNRLMMFLGVPSAQTDTTLVRNVTDTFRFLPCNDSYLINNVAARAILPHFLPMRFPVHLQFTFAAARIEGMPLQMIAPNVFIDGTKLGVFPSNVEPNNRLLFNSVYNRLSQMIDAYDDKEASTKPEIEELFKAFEYKSNPEYMYLKAKYEVKKGNFDFAMALFKHTYSQYDAIGAPLSQGSEFMKDYMRLFREFQD
jgi:GR25 family glycosyltransferase involved in LPS biosynthesis